MAAIENTLGTLIPELVSGSDVVTEPAFAYNTNGLSDRSSLKLVHVSREGLSYAKFTIAINAFQFTKQELSKVLHISDRTLERIHKEKKRLSTPHTERILELSLLFEQGWECFNNKKHFRKWLDDTYIPYGGVTPLSLLDTKQGIDLVHTALGRMQHGIFA